MLYRGTRGEEKTSVGNFKIISMQPCSTLPQSAREERITHDSSVECIPSQWGAKFACTNNENRIHNGCPHCCTNNPRISSSPASQSSRSKWAFFRMRLDHTIEHFGKSEKELLAHQIPWRSSVLSDNGQQNKQCSRSCASENYWVTLFFWKV